MLFVGSTKGLGMSDLVFGESPTMDAGKATNSYIISIFEIEGAGLVGILLKDEIIILKEGRAIQTIKIDRPLDKVTNLTTGQYLITSSEHKTGLFLTLTDEEKMVHDKTRTPTMARCIFVDREQGVWMGGCLLYTSDAADE